MKTNKEHRFQDNPKEQEFHDKFKEMFEQGSLAKKTLSAIVFGWNNDHQNVPKEYLSEKEEDVCLNIIQWLGSPVGHNFLASCGYVLKDENR